MSAKKARERFFLDQLARVYPDFPPGIVIEGEAPDFLVQSLDSAIGIDITEYHAHGPADGKAGSFERMQSQLRKRALALAVREYEAK